MPDRMLDKMPEVIWLWGPTGTGKSKAAVKKYWSNEPFYMWSPLNGQWWDRYDGEKKIILDEFRGTPHFELEKMLTILDWKPCIIPYKGGFVNIQADKFIITSPYPPRVVYRDVDQYDKLDQLLRRITQIVEHKFDSNFKPNSVDQDIRNFVG